MKDRTEYKGPHPGVRCLGLDGGLDRRCCCT